MTGLSAVAGASGEADTRALYEEARRGRTERDSAEPVESSAEDTRATESAAKAAEFDRQDHERDAQEERSQQEQARETESGSLLDVVG